ncbi:hypothetical protein TSUD_302370 [Trifolium subterraneum]|uniref:Uncharacterized protein n=1 Tax=Trifolium subterraneum TaxID=3900 RepID=A0A2Z6NGV8_TRISU|nr:hypothetical protein TSUD_302370 [Trifolium subterraneum]
MICPDRSNKPGSNWLDRLRFNKGIPTGEDLDLDSFLLKLTSHSPQPPPIKPPRHRPTITDDPPLSVVISQLFNPSATVTLTTKKCPRKQTNPKIFLASSTTTAAVNTLATTGGVAPVEVENRGEEGEDGEEDLKGFTKSEVTVIDTSCSVWKVDKFVFRKNSVWKVRERKQKNKFFAKKKSKVTHEFDIHGIGSSK